MSLANLRIKIVSFLPFYGKTFNYIKNLSLSQTLIPLTFADLLAPIRFSMYLSGLKWARTTDLALIRRALWPTEL